MYNCFDVADYFLWKAEEENEGLDPMKLLKLTYIAHGYNLGFYGKALFPNKVQAWKYGTVIPELYHVVKRFKTNNVDKETISLYKENNISGDQKKLLDSVWKAYKGLNGLQLSELTHRKGTPWEKLFDNTYNVTISNDLIEEHYKNIISNKREPETA